MGKHSMLTVRSLNNEKYLKFYGGRLSARYQTLIWIIWKLGDTVQSLESLGLSGRVDSTEMLFRDANLQ